MRSEDESFPPIHLRLTYEQGLYRVRFDDGKTWEGALRDPFYEIIEEGDAALLRADQNVDRKHFADAIALAAKLAERPLACAELRLARPHVAGFGTILLRATTPCASPRERVHEQCVALLSKTKPSERDAASFRFGRAASSRARAADGTPVARRRLSTPSTATSATSSAQATLARLLRIGVLQGNAPAEDTLIGAALEAVRAADGKQRRVVVAEEPSEDVDEPPPKRPPPTRGDKWEALFAV